MNEHSAMNCSTIIEDSVDEYLEDPNLSVSEMIEKVKLLEGFIIFKISFFCSIIYQS